MRCALLVLLVVAITSVTAFAEPPDDSEQVRHDVALAIAKGDIGTIAHHASFPFTAHHLWFDTPACAKFAVTQVEITKDELRALVDCLRGLGIHEINAPSATITYGPGIPLRLSMSSDGTHFEGLESEPSWQAGAAVIEPALFVPHVKNFRREVAPGPETKVAIDAKHDPVIAAAFACFDARGNIDTLELELYGLGEYREQVEAAVRAWKVKPFLAHGKAVAVCTSLEVGYPEPALGQLQLISKVRREPPRSTAGGHAPGGASGVIPNLAPTLVEAQRISGTTKIEPRGATKRKILASGLERVVAMFKLCVNSAGEVSRTLPLKSSGFWEYDVDLSLAMDKWTYHPLQVNGKPTAVCTVVTFIYSPQK